MPRFSTTILGLDDEKAQEELKLRGPSAMLALSPYLKVAFDKFEYDFQVSNLPEGKYIKPRTSTSKWYKVGQPCFEDRLRELNSYFAKSVSPLNPLGPLWARFNYRYSKNLSIRQGKISALLILRLPLLRLLLFVIPSWKSARTVSSLLPKGSKAKFKIGPILKKQPDVAMKQPVTI